MIYNNKVISSFCETYTLLLRFLDKNKVFSKLISVISFFINYIFQKPYSIHITLVDKLSIYISPYYLIL